MDALLYRAAIGALFYKFILIILRTFKFYDFAVSLISPSFIVSYSSCIRRVLEHRKSKSLTASAIPRFFSVFKTVPFSHRVSARTLPSIQRTSSLRAFVYAGLQTYIQCAFVYAEFLQRPLPPPDAASLSMIE